jgi:hypothetical protein
MKIKKFFRNRYRIIEDSYAGYEVQIFSLGFPFWVQCWNPITHQTSNTFASIYNAEEFIRIHRTKSMFFPIVVKNVDLDEL